MTELLPALPATMEIENSLKAKIVHLELRDWLGGTRLFVKFTNGWGLSIIRNFGSYGGSEGLFEAAVFNNQGELDFDNPVIPDDPEGWLTNRDVVHRMNLLASYTAEELRDYQNHDDTAPPALEEAPRALETLPETE